MAAKKPRKRTAKDRQADARFYEKHKSSRISQVRAQEAKHPESTKTKKAARAKSQAKTKAPAESAKCPNCGQTGGRKEFHHTSYDPPRGYMACSLCNPRGGAV
jgi:DNA-directed RNA polymerase subunit M/transcription elongation factor TFIIS